jgi:hypothetical protein
MVGEGGKEGLKRFVGEWGIYPTGSDRAGLRHAPYLSNSSLLSTLIRESGEELDCRLKSLVCVREIVSSTHARVLRVRALAVRHRLVEYIFTKVSTGFGLGCFVISYDHPISDRLLPSRSMGQPGINISRTEIVSFYIRMDVVVCPMSGWLQTYVNKPATAQSGRYVRVSSPWN